MRDRRADGGSASNRFLWPEAETQGTAVTAEDGFDPTGKHPAQSLNGGRSHDLRRGLLTNGPNH